MPRIDKLTAMQNSLLTHVGTVDDRTICPAGVFFTKLQCLVDRVLRETIQAGSLLRRFLLRCIVFIVNRIQSPTERKYPTFRQESA